MRKRRRWSKTSRQTSCNFAPKSCSPLFTSDYIGPIANQLSKTVLSAINGTLIHLGFIPHILRDLTKLEAHPVCLTEALYTWCSVVYENRQSLGDWERLLLICLEIGFRHLDFQYLFTGWCDQPYLSVYFLSRHPITPNVSKPCPVTAVS